MWGKCECSYICANCGVKYGRMANDRNHIWLFHEARNLSCENCELFSKNLYFYKSHLSLKHVKCHVLKNSLMSVKKVKRGGRGVFKHQSFMREWPTGILAKEVVQVCWPKRKLNDCTGEYFCPKRSRFSEEFKRTEILTNVLNLKLISSNAQTKSCRLI